MYHVAAPQRYGYARHLYYFSNFVWICASPQRYVGLIQLLQQFRSCKYCMTEVNFFFIMYVVSDRSGYRNSLKGCYAWIQNSRAT